MTGIQQNRRIPSLRRAVWGKDKLDPQDIGEALRDLYTAFAAVAPGIATLVNAPGVRWSVPFAIAYDHLPQVVMLGNARLANQAPTGVACGTVGWVWQNSQISVTGVDGLVPGTAYDLVFMVFG